MDRTNDQRRGRNRGRNDQDRPERRDGGDRRDASRGRQEARPEPARADARSERARQDRAAFSQYSREEKFPPIPQPPKRDYAPDPLSGQPIDNIYTAFNARDGEQPVAFDSVITQLRNAENLSDNQQLIYVGSGQFGVYEEVEEGGKKRLVLQRKIAWEDSHHKPDWRRELAPGISRDYKPTPEPLDRLYSAEEERAFPKIGAGTTAYMPRNM